MSEKQVALVTGAAKGIVGNRQSIASRWLFGDHQ